MPSLSKADTTWNGNLPFCAKNGLVTLNQPGRHMDGHARIGRTSYCYRTTRPTCIRHPASRIDGQPGIRTVSQHPPAVASRNHRGKCPNFLTECFCAHEMRYLVLRGRHCHHPATPARAGRGERHPKNRELNTLDLYRRLRVYLPDCLEAYLLGGGEEIC